jgi:4-amino-4-deoxy-L-arabinose transferase-like glycosyltransferase
VRRHRRSEKAESRWGGLPVAFAAVLGLAVALRLVGLQSGLPLLNPGEREIVPRAWEMTHGGGLDPRWFDRPSLVLYLVAPFQSWQEDPSYLAARLVIVAVALGAVAAAWWLGHRAYGPMAGFLAAAATAVATTHVAFSRIAITDVPLTLGVAVALALMVAGRVELAGLAAGLATSAQYEGVVLLAPLVAAAWGSWRRLALAGALAAVGFAATSPYVVLHFGEAASDAWSMGDPAPIALVERLWDALGPALLVAAAGLVVAVVLRTRADLVLGVFCLAYVALLLTIDAPLDRGALPLIPALGALAGRLRSLAPVTALLLIIPLTWSIKDARELAVGSPPVTEVTAIRAE